MLTSAMTSKGQITIPSILRKEMGVKPSDKVLFIREGKRIVVEKVASISSLFGSLANSKVKPLSSNEINTLIAEGMFKRK